MAWDKRRTARKSQVRVGAVDLIYLGLNDKSRSAAMDELVSPRLGERFTLTSNKALTIGRSEHCEVTLASDRLEPCQALVTLLPEPETLALVDLSSTGACWVDGRQGAFHRLRIGDEFELLQVYRFRLQFAAE